MVDHPIHTKNTQAGPFSGARNVTTFDHEGVFRNWLVRLALDAYVARRTLLRSRKLLGPGLGFPHLAECRFDMV